LSAGLPGEQVNIATLLKILGHTDISTRMIYAHLSQEHIKNQMLESAI